MPLIKTKEKKNENTHGASTKFAHIAFDDDAMVPNLFLSQVPGKKEEPFARKCAWKNVCTHPVRPQFIFGVAFLVPADINNKQIKMSAKQKKKKKKTMRLLNHRRIPQPQKQNKNK